MIPSTTNQLLVSENWTKIYQSYRNADFQSYDFETLRRTMIGYLREHYPEDFNDYIDSSEYMALVDLIAYLGQNLSFRIDLNARENFLETAQRRDSVLRLAQLISYNARRNLPANGFLKIVSVSTNDNVIDANGTSLANQIINWNDPSNSNWYQQFIAVMNNSMASNFVFGRPYDSNTINGIQTEQYRINSSNTDLPVYGFSANISGTQMNFEVVSSSFANQSYVYEEAPKPANQFGYIYKNDNQGNGSSNTGFFVHFRQGALSRTSFNIANPVPNNIIGVNATNINDTDTWLWQLNAAGNYDTLWTQVNTLVGNNVIYNSINNSTRSIYTVTTRDNDQIDLNFADGSFGDLPKGQFSLFYRQSNGLNYVIKPQQLSNIGISIPYTNKNGQNAVLNITCSLQATVDNSTGAESNDQIRQKAPQTYYTQNRMITAEDYNIAPLSAGNDILKIKSVNRISSGISKYFDLVDITGQYSSTNIFANDGILYKEPKEENFEFSFVNQNEIMGALLNQLAPAIDSKEMFNFYLEQYPRVTGSNPLFVWNKATLNTNQTTGYFSSNDLPLAVGGYTDNNLKYVSPGAMVKFVLPAGQYFLPNNEITNIQDSTTKNYIWSKIVAVVGDGFNNGLGLLSNQTGPITVSGNVPDAAIVEQIIPVFASVLSTSLHKTMVNICLTTRNFGISYDTTTRQWFIITDNNLDLSGNFNLAFQKDTQNINRDSSWLVAFEWTGINYRVRYKTLNYIFESLQQTAFYVDNTAKNYDFVSGAVIKDQIRVLSINQNPTFLSTISPTVNVPWSTSTYLTTSTAARVNYKNTVTQSGYTTTSTGGVITGTVTASVVYIPTVTSQYTSQWTPEILKTKVAAVPGTTFLTFSTLTEYFGAIDPCVTHLDFEPKFYAFHSGIGQGYGVVLSQNDWSPVTGITIQLETPLSDYINSGSNVIFVPIKMTGTNTFVGPTTSSNTVTQWSTASITLRANWTTATSVNVTLTTSTQTTVSVNMNGIVSGTTTTVLKSNALSLSNDYAWQVDSAVIEPDGFINPNKVKVSFFDVDDDGQIDDPDAFLNIVQPVTTSTQTGYQFNFVYFKYDASGQRYKLTNDNILAFPNQAAVTTPIDGQLYYFYESDINVVQSWSASTVEWVLQPDYFAYYGRQGLKFQYLHQSGQDRRIDPSKTNLIDIYVLTQSYDTEYRTWLAQRYSTTPPTPPTSSALEENFASSLASIKSISDELVFQPTRYKILFGDLADTALQATFKAVRNPASSASDNDIKTRIITAIETFFSIDYWEFGQSFYFSELSTYVMNQLTPDITNFLIVPKSSGSFGSLYEVQCQSNEIFINGATAVDIDVISALTASQLKTAGSIVTSTTGQ